MKYFVLSDVHSFYEQMMQALTEKGFDINNKEHCVIICGDLFDRGPDAVKCFEFVKKLNDEGRLIYVCGNHEDLLFDCYNEVICGRGVSSHHRHNGTLGTIGQFTGLSYYDLTFLDIERRREVIATMQPILEFINNECVNYAEIGEYIFVHGWVPAYQHLDDFRDGSDEDWEQARWENGMDMWRNKKCRVPNYTVVCGHWHCSWGHSRIRQTHKEFPQKNQKNWRDSFQPFVDEGIIAFDACTAYTEFCNCLVLEV